MRVLPLITPTQLDIKATNMKEFTWNSDTIEYFKNRNKPGCEGQYYREVLDFVKNDCHLEDGETYEMLANDLMSKTIK